MRVCEIPECTGKHMAKGFCVKHYRRWQKHGDPNRPPLTWRDLFWTHVEVTGFCWNWMASREDDGYGRAGQGGSSGYAHRIAYELMVGPIREGLQIDHLCRNRACVNPDHLEPVTPAENTRRSYSRRARPSRCSRGHEYTPDNTYYPPGRSARICRECTRLYRQKYKRARKMHPGPVDPDAFLTRKGVSP